ncbi:uncharacterized protein YegL [Acinetobacter baylyi]|uniref:Uncharacterized protein YegL n=1 Tax=Acinetobacter baylyi TaxID=202950 RepID=A0ABU0US34_ACIBI|nr:TerY-C metal binding domain-containing protein [Acinetobacter baylyi]MDQ1207365.1 uncharacterized protein YegL [Acinetobacter baylyi]MDR6105553.1 uncharacterized protein YegL [Acinetobacter baylyi]MDR6184236.1 uncharacterized protein YegL [Acinetobacter baylyi]
MRRLPVFFVLDCSESMAGQNIQQMQQGIQLIMQQLRQDPYALETVYVSVIAFAGIVRTLVPLVEVFAYYPAKLPLGGGTHLGKALEHLMNEFDRHLIKTTEQTKGDWKPIAYLFTDGRPTDECKDAIYRWQKKYARRCTLIALGMGKNVDYATLKQLTEHCIAFDELNEKDFKKFFQWISASVVAQSKSIGDGQQQDYLPPIDERYMRLVKDLPAKKNLVDENCVTFVGRCGKLNRPYLMKFEREIQYQAPQDLNINLNLYHFQLTECCKIDEDYFTWSDQTQHQQQVNTTLLQGTPECPHCLAETAFAMCGCGQLMCYDGFSEDVTCPWCRRQVSFDYGGMDGFNVQRGRG